MCIYSYSLFNTYVPKRTFSAIPDYYITSSCQMQLLHGRHFSNHIYN